MIYVPYICDTETTSLDLINGDIIELSLFRFTTGEQKTWFLKPLNFEAIDVGALRINGHKLEDITWKTAYGRETYKEPKEVIVDIENWIMEDDAPTENRIFVAHNVTFDLPRMERLWTKCDSKDSFVFGRRSLDTMSLEFFIDWCKGTMAEGYSLKNLTKKYGLKNEKAHSAACDTKVAAEIFQAQIDTFKKTMSGGDKDLISENKKMKLLLEQIGKIVKPLDDPGAHPGNAESAGLDILELYKKYLND